MNVKISHKIKIWHNNNFEIWFCNRKKLRELSYYKNVVKE